MKRWFCILALALSFLLPALPAEAATESISTTRLLDSIAEARGKVVLVNFFAAFCPPCRKEIPGLIRIREEYPEEELLIIGVAVDRDLRQMEDFIARSGFNYPVFYGGEEVAYAFRVDAIPHNVLYSKEGKIVFDEAGYIPERHLRKLLDELIKGKL